MTLALFAYQRVGAAWLAARRRALLWDEQGVGKSAQVITAADAVNALSVLVVCPAGVREHWRREWQTWGQRHHREVTIVSYERATTDWQQLGQPRWDLVVIDEHQYLKNPGAQRTKAVLGSHGVIRNARRVWALSGTPMPNTPDELWTILRTLAPETILLDGRPMSRSSFISRYCRTEENLYGTKVVGSRNLGELATKLKPHTLRRKKVDVLADLPPMIWAGLALEPTPQEMKALEALPYYDRMRHHAAVGLDILTWLLSDIDSEHISALVRMTGEIKARLLVRVLKDELQGSDHKLVIGYWHRSVGATLMHELRQFGAVRVEGSTSPRDRAMSIDAFQNEARYRVFLGQLRAAGTGISLTAASQVLLAEQSWVPADNAQFAARPHRIGQRSSVLVRNAFLAGSIDEPLAGVLMRKSMDIAQVIDATTTPTHANDNTQPVAGAA